MLHELSCPNCGAPGLEATQPNGVVVCNSCGNRFTADDSVACAHCETVNEPEAEYCGSCGERLKRTCAACGAENWAGAEHCTQCGRGLDALEHIAERNAKGFRETLAERRRTASTVKAEEEEASQRRLAEMWQVEQRRQEGLAREVEQQKSEQNTMARITLLFGGAFVCLILAGAVAWVFLNLTVK